jgi:serine/threonine protein kinase
MPKAKTTNQELIGQGTYGCVFKPGFKCDGKNMRTKKFITKIQRKGDTTEKKIGAQVIKIPHYADFFAPILNTCDISLAKIESDEIQKCDFIDDVKEEKMYESGKMKYVGKQSLEESILEKYIKNPNYIMFALLRTHNHLLAALQKIAKIGIIHFDLKEKNIICNDKTGTPIIIDFGLSIDTKEENPYKEIQNYKNPYYFPWPIDVVFVYKYFENPGFKITERYLQEEIETFTQKSYLYNVLSNEELDEYRKKAFDYYKQFVGGSVKDVYEDSVKYSMTWDNYSLSWVYVNILKNVFYTVSEEDEKINKYREYLTSVIMSMSKDRPTPETTEKTIGEIFKTITKSEIVTLQKSLNKEILFFN